MAQVGEGGRGGGGEQSESPTINAAVRGLALMTLGLEDREGRLQRGHCDASD